MKSSTECESIWNFWQLAKQHVHNWRRKNNSDFDPQTNNNLIKCRASNHYFILYWPKTVEAKKIVKRRIKWFNYNCDFSRMNSVSIAKYRIHLANQRMRDTFMCFFFSFSLVFFSSLQYIHIYTYILQHQWLQQQHWSHTVSMKWFLCHSRKINRTLSIADYV